MPTIHLLLYNPKFRTASTEPHFLYITAVPLLPYWQNSLYSTKVPVQYGNTSTPIWAVRILQNFRSCKVHLYIYSPYGNYGLYLTSELVEFSYNSTIPMGRTDSPEHHCP